MSRASRFLPAFAFLALVALAGCGGEKEPPTARGDWKPLAPGLWDIDPARVSVPLLPKA